MNFLGIRYLFFHPNILFCTTSRLVDEAVSKAKGGHYQIACAAAFEGVHNCPCDTGINHPNQYFEESRNVSARNSEGNTGMDIDPPSTPISRVFQGGRG